MKLRFNTTAFAALIAAALATSISTARAGHVYAGIIDTNGTAGYQPGDALSFVNSSTGAVVTGESQGVQAMTMVSVGDQAGLFFTNNITWTALQTSGNVWSGTAYRAAKAFGASMGSDIEVQLSSITGPSGGTFAFWEEFATSETFAFTNGVQTIGTASSFMLTDYLAPIGDGVNDGTGEPPTGLNTNSASNDPFGHIHGRSFTVDTPGIYTVNYILHDLSGQHPDSSPFVVTYATPEPGRAMLVASGLGCLFLRRRRAK